MIYTPEHGSVNMISQYLKTITLIWQRLVQPKLQYDPSKQLTKWETLREPYEKIPQKLFLSHIDRMMNGNIDHDTQPDSDTSVEPLDPTPTNPRSSKYDLRHNPKPNCNDDYRYWLCQITVYGTHTYTFRKHQESVMELICGKPTYSVKHLKALRNNYWALQTE